MKINMESTMPQIAAQLLTEVRRNVQELGHVPDELLQGLAFVFGAPTLPALDLVDNRSVSRLLSPSGRYAYQVLGSSGTVYTCSANSLYCSCPAFLYSVVRKSDVLLCKHLLAAHVSEALGQCTEVFVSDSTMTELMAFRDN